MVLSKRFGIMASYMKGKLPTFKVTQRLRGGLIVFLEEEVPGS